MQQNKRHWLHNLWKALGIDQAIAYTAINRGWTLISGALSLLLISHFLTPVEQGYYFTFADILALQIFFELGLSTVLVPFASHEFAHLRWTEEGILEGDSTAKSRLASLLRFSLLWYGAVALAVLLFVLPGGIWFFSHYHRAGIHVHWELPWVWIVLVTSGSLAVTPLLCILEGCGLIAQIARLQMQQTIVGTVLFWIALTLHWGINTAPITNTVAFLWSGLWVFGTYWRWIQDLWRHPTSYARVNWKTEILPFHWRIAVCWLSSYAVLRMFDPILFATHGPVMAGQMGMSLAVMASIAAFALSWVTTKSAPFGMLISKQEYDTLDGIFFPSLWQSLLIELSAGGLFWCAAVALQRFYPRLGTRFLAPLPLLLLVATTVVYHIVNAEWIYLRAHKQEPFLGIALLAGILIAGGSLLLAKPYGATGVMGVYFLVHLVVSFGGGTLIFLKKRNEWHRSRPTDIPLKTIE
ncbi:hypothetical protein CWRG_02405 [Chthonomonas calidirosea]|uniref:hypothetical protein n=1 Tax=Chthonomonas calidirosea TaxID=454171 RepID=UPI0006DD3CAE|nr:hypothetical protein [Chthonomonas calidirosea]CEK19144.1 hypothetical protein CWRG_02405 [Chthonomonas calidirosea]CEK19153.1 hypothetical protein CP488_02424 [Chthonomonas calidirosea]